MSNPRPCKCGHPLGGHAAVLTDEGWFGVCYRCYPVCLRYRPAKRTEPLRAKRPAHTSYRQPQRFARIGTSPIPSRDVLLTGERILTRQQVDAMAARISRQVTANVFAGIRRSLGREGK